MNIKKAVLAALLAVIFGVQSRAEQIDCDRVGAKVLAAVESAPDQVLVIVEDMIVANELCACEVIKAAILGSKADGDEIRAIVFTAVTASPGMAATIAECAIAVAPSAGEHIKLGLEDALVGGSSGIAGQGKAPVYAAGGKAPVYAEGKEPVDVLPGAGESSGVGYGAPAGGFSFFPIATGGGVIEQEEAPVIEIVEQEEAPVTEVVRVIEVIEVVEESPEESGPPPSVVETEAPPVTSSSPVIAANGA